jgi:hypothetical protein
MNKPEAMVWPYEFVDVRYKTNRRTVDCGDKLTRVGGVTLRGDDAIYR